MAIKCGFFDASDLFTPYTTEEGETILIPDRAYSASDLNEYLKCLVDNTGAIYQYGKAFQIKKIPDDQITPEEAAANPNSFKLSVGSGAGRIRGHYMTVDGSSDVFVTHGSANGDRWDRIIFRLNLGSRDITLNVIPGKVVEPGAQSGSSLSKDVYWATTDEDNDAGIYDIQIAEVFVPMNSTNVSDISVVMTTGQGHYCPWITHIIYHSPAQGAIMNNFDAFLDMYKDAFYTFFKNLSDNLEVSTNIVQKEMFQNSGNNWDLNSIDGYEYTCDDDGNPRDVINVFYNGLKLRDTEYQISSMGILSLVGKQYIAPGNELYVQILISQIGIPSYVDGDLIKY